MGQQIGSTTLGTSGNTSVRRDSIVAAVLDKLQLSPLHIKQLHKIFQEININNSGLIQRAEFYIYFKINPNSLYDKIFSLFDFDHSGYLSFMEFVCAMWNFCSMSPDNLASFAFYLFNDNRSGCLDLHQLAKLICVLHRKSPTANPEIRALINKITNRYPEMSEINFMRCSHEMPAIIAPLLAVQFSMRQQLLGEKFWRKITAARLKNPIQVTHDFIAALEIDTLDRLKARKEKELIALEESQKEAVRQRILDRHALISDREKGRCDRMLQHYGMQQKLKEGHSKLVIVTCAAYDTYDGHIDVMRSKISQLKVKQKPQTKRLRSPSAATTIPV